MSLLHSFDATVLHRIHRISSDQSRLILKPFGMLACSRSLVLRSVSLLRSFFLLQVKCASSGLCCSPCSHRWHGFFLHFFFFIGMLPIDSLSPSAWGQRLHRCCRSLLVQSTVDPNVGWIIIIGSFADSSSLDDGRFGCRKCTSCLVTQSPTGDISLVNVG